MRCSTQREKTGLTRSTALSEREDGPDMKRMINKAIAIILLAVLALSLSGCGEKKEDLPISPIDIAQAQGIMGGIFNTDAESAEGLLDMEDDEIEDFFKQYGYSIDGKAFRNGLEAWVSLSEEFGDVGGPGEPQMTSNDKEVIATFPIQGSRRTGKTVIVMNEKGKIVSITTSADYTLEENMTKAGLNTLLGMGTTFAILIFLSIIISLFKLLPNSGVAKAKEDKMAAPVSKAVSQIAEREELESGNETDDAELVAVITAAVAAFAGASGGTSGDGFVVRSIRRRY